MKFSEKNPPRKFRVGNTVQWDMSDCGEILLNPDEQVTFVTEAGGQYDVARKDWGFYATPSLNGRLTDFRLRGVLVKNRGTGRYFVLLVESGGESSFDAYCDQENLAVIVWMDETANLDHLASVLGTGE